MPEFSHDDKKKIAKAVKTVLAAPRDGNAQPRPSNPSELRTFFWGTLSAEVNTSGVYTYDFTEILFPSGTVSNARATGGIFPKVKTVNGSKCNTGVPALLRQDITTGGTVYITIISEAAPLVGPIKKYQVLQATSDATGTGGSIPGTYGWDFPLIHN